MKTEQHYTCLTWFVGAGVIIMVAAVRDYFSLATLQKFVNVFDN